MIKLSNMKHTEECFNTRLNDSSEIFLQVRTPLYNMDEVEHAGLLYYSMPNYFIRLYWYWNKFSGGDTIPG